MKQTLKNSVVVTESIGMTWALALAVNSGHGFWGVLVRFPFSWVYVIWHYLH